MTVVVADYEGVGDVVGDGVSPSSVPSSPDPEPAVALGVGVLLTEPPLMGGAVACGPEVEVW